LDWSELIYLGLATLVVGCPCALIISTPVAIVTAIGNAAKHGVLIKGGIHLEETGRLKVVAFDKTGTLTVGRPAVRNIIPVGEITENEILQIAMTIEQYSQHPIATAILERSNKLQIAPLQSGNFQSITGKGAKTTINNRTYYIGNKRLFKEMNAITINDEIVQQINDLENLGNTVMMLGTRENILGIIAVADQIREESKSIIERLYQLGIQKTFMLTGDNELTAKAIASEVDITDVKANLMPEDKLNVIKNIKEKHKRVAMEIGRAHV